MPASDNHDGPIKELHSKVDVLNGKVDLLSNQMVELRVKVELQGRQLEQAGFNTQQIAKLDTWVKVLWAVTLCVLAGILAIVAQLVQVLGQNTSGPFSI